MSAIYNGLNFKTRLEAQWAAFFDLAKWEWWVNPVPVGDWVPDFRVTFQCNHSECSGSHTLLVAVLPLAQIDENFKNHPSLQHMYGFGINDYDAHTGTYSGAYKDFGVSIDAGAMFGASPKATTWQMSHGSGGGIENVCDWVDHPESLWSQAAHLVK